MWQAGAWRIARQNGKSSVQTSSRSNTNNPRIPWLGSRGSTVTIHSAARRIDQTDLHADKTANATTLNEKQKWVYNQYRKFASMISRAHWLIIDPEVKEAFDIRFLQGYTRKETILFMRRGVAHSTVDRRIADGIESIANTLKVMGFFEEIQRKF
ncbi:hypothetical protein [Paenibacillus sp. 8b26]|uniref:hypothetical protein n=1 Tax=Paenibacillus sp. 8b26 TaxID=3424133 RepID=UPI003D65B2B4